MRTPALLRSELLKLRSIPSTYVVIVAAVCIGLGVGVLEMTSTSHHWLQLDPQDRAAFDPVADSFSGFQFAELAFGALGVLAITTEYATGTMQATLVASPRRMQVYAAKLAALILVVRPSASPRRSLPSSSDNARSRIGTSTSPCLTPTSSAPSSEQRCTWSS